MAEAKAQSAEVTQHKRGRGRPPKAQSKPKESPLQWISNETLAAPYVTIDSQQRLSIPVPTRKLLGLDSGKFQLIVGFDPVNKRIVLAKPEVVRVTDVKPFKFDKRSYSKARKIVEQANLQDLPVRFQYVGQEYSMYPDGAYAFVMDGYEAPDS